MYYNDEEAVLDLTSDLDTIDPDEFEERYNQLDADDRLAVDEIVREFAANAIGDEHWDSDD